jgi:hypothetical protein
MSLSSQSSAPRLLVAVTCALALACRGRERPRALAHDCKTAIDIVSHYRPQPGDEWAWSMLQSCGPTGGVAARDAWRSLRTERDTRAIAAVHDALWTFRDSSLFDEARRFVADGGASPETRVFSAMLLVEQLVDGRLPDYATFSATDSIHSCGIAFVSDWSSSTGAPLPSDALNLARATADSVLTSPSAPPIVKQAARCLEGALVTEEFKRARTQPASGRQSPSAH